MKRVIVVALLAGSIVGFGGSRKPRLDENAVLFVEAAGALETLPGPVWHTVSSLVSTIFGKAGIPVRWSRPAAAGRTPDVRRRIVVHFSGDSFYPDPLACPGAAAFGCSRPFADGSVATIVVMCDRLRFALHRPRFYQALMAHVIVHEITHVIERRDFHSDAGIMKEAWSRDDYRELEFSPLGFTALHLELLRQSIESYGRR